MHHEDWRDAEAVADKAGVVLHAVPARAGADPEDDRYENEADRLHGGATGPAAGGGRAAAAAAARPHRRLWIRRGRETIENQE